MLKPGHALGAILLAGTSLPLSAAAPNTSLQVGAARVDMTGPFGPAQSGKYDHEHVYARAIFIDNHQTRAVLAAFDGPYTGFDMLITRQAIAKEFNVPLDQIVITHSHTHSPSADPAQSPAQQELAKKAAPFPALLAAVRQAHAALQPAVMGYGEGLLHLNVNRDAIDPTTRAWVQGSNMDGPEAPTVYVLSFETPKGAPIAVSVSYAMHPIDGYVAGIVSGDFPEAMQRYVEKAFGDTAVVNFSQAPSGDQNPLYLRPSTNVMASRDGQPITGYQMYRETFEGPLRVADMSGKPAPAADPKVMDAMFRFAESEGQIFGEEVIRIMTFLKHKTPNARIEGLQKTVSCPGRVRVNDNPLDLSAREGGGASYKDGAPVDLHVGMLGIGNVGIMHINGEVFTRIGDRIRYEAPLRNTMLTTIANERVQGYIPDDASYGHQTFQVLGARLKPGCAERGITDAVVDLENTYLGDQ